MEKNEVEVRREVVENCTNASREIKTLQRELAEFPNRSFKEIMYHGAVATISTMAVGFSELLIAALGTGTSVTVQEMNRRYFRKSETGRSLGQINKMIGEQISIIQYESRRDMDAAIFACGEFKIDVYTERGYRCVSVKRLIDLIKDEKETF